MKLSKLIAMVICTGILATSAAFAEEGAPQVNQEIKVQKELVKADREKLKADRTKLREERKAARAARKARKHHEKKQS